MQCLNLTHSDLRLCSLSGNAFTPCTVYVAGCSLKADKKEHKVEVDDDEAEHQLSLKAVRQIHCQFLPTNPQPRHGKLH